METHRLAWEGHAPRNFLHLVLIVHPSDTGASFFRIFRVIVAQKLTPVILILQSLKILLRDNIPWATTTHLIALLCHWPWINIIELGSNLLPLLIFLLLIHLWHSALSGYFDLCICVFPGTQILHYKYLIDKAGFFSFICLHFSIHLFNNLRLNSFL